MSRRSTVTILVQVRDRASAALTGIRGSANKLKNALFSVKGLIVGLASAAVVRTGMKLVEMFNRQERAVLRLNQVLRNTGRFSKEASDALIKNAQALQRVTTKGDEEILEAVSRAAELATDLTTDQLLKMQEVIIGLGDTFFRGDLEQAALLVGKTIGSSTNALSRYGVELDTTGSQQEKFAQIVDKTNKFFLTSKAAAGDLGGQIVQMKNAFGDLEETLGEVIVRVFNLDAGTGSLKDRFVEWNDSIQANMQQWVHWGKIGVASVGLVASAVWNTITAAYHLGEAIGLAIRALFVRIQIAFLKSTNAWKERINETLIEPLNHIPGVNIKLLDTDAKRDLDELNARLEQYNRLSHGALGQIKGDIEDVADAAAKLAVVIESPPVISDRRNLGAIDVPADPNADRMTELESGQQAFTDALREQMYERAGLRQVEIDGIKRWVSGTIDLQEQAAESLKTLMEVAGPIGPDDAAIARQNAQLNIQVSTWEKIAAGILEATGNAEVMGNVVGDMITSFLDGAANSLESAFEAIASGNEDASAALAKGMANAIGSIAHNLGKLWLAQGTAALAKGILGDPKGFAAAAKYFAAATAAFALSGSISGGISGGGGGGASGGSSGGVTDRTNSLTDVEDRPVTLVIQGEPVLDMSNPDVEDRMKRALEDLSGRRVIIERR